MLRKGMRGKAAGLVLVAMLAATAPALAAGGLAHHQGNGGGLWAEIWDWIGVLWAKQGSHIDPDGRTGTATVDQGPCIDPNGATCTTCAGTTTLETDRGAGIDPDGAR